MVFLFCPLCQMLVRIRFCFLLNLFVLFFVVPLVFQVLSHLSLLHRCLLQNLCSFFAIFCVPEIIQVVQNLKQIKIQDQAAVYSHRIL